MAIPLGKPSDKADRPERRPGLGLAQRGAGRGASCRENHRQSGRSCCRFRTPSFADRVAAKCGVCVVALLGFVVRPGLGLAQRGAGRGAEGCVR